MIKNLGNTKSCTKRRTIQPPEYNDITSDVQCKDNANRDVAEFNERLLLAAQHTTCYVDYLIRPEDIPISPYDPYILKWAYSSYRRYINDVNGDILSIKMCKQYIKYLITDVDAAADTAIWCGPVSCIEENLIQDICPEYHNILSAWRIIITVNSIYMDMWNNNGKLRKIFGHDCEPFLLRCAIIDKCIPTKIHNIRTWYEYMESLKQQTAIHRNKDGLPIFESVSNIINHFPNKLYFYIGAEDIRNYVTKRKTINNLSS